mmetsp:Transcript_101641/g.282892  ORF Transcript_101641/g.282892 Transcript_101641/m.282892 type:complete len:452 (+) Transcript_101641:74-1429(+)|eukprot:CAMPEP_0179055132 /NCGR_PEP_ID=MMETSP0796-20121207/23143_1 /TAXON_ID=73915 /ORGANISM="Pyrodinium bahamense, Strain pbaha01" /LENGTH=451 /DNA_ID=CAMNT_0020751775 /DNA_START=27 /DNA_END=1382 /DNA_ORIENTATION=+
MAKKGKSKVPSAPSGPSGAASAAPAAPPLPSPNKTKQEEQEDEAAANQRKWKETAAANQKKAELSQQQSAAENARRQEWERHQQSVAVKKKAEERKWEKQLESIIARATKEGILRSEDWGDDRWWVKIGDMYKEVQGQFYCTMCDKHLCAGTLQAHLDSDLHRRRLAWNQPSEATSGAGTASAARPASAPGAPPPCTSSTSAASAPSTVPLEDWQEMTADGFLRCVPCGKVIDEHHLAKDDHVARLWRWRAEEKCRRCGYEAPELPYLAFVPWDGTNPDGERCLKCLLCNKWVQDESSHTGTFSAPAGAKDHQKNLRNYGPGDPWYEANVVAERRRWHPSAPASPVAAANAVAPTYRSGGAAAAAATGATPAAPAPWAKAAPAAAAPPPPPVQTRLKDGWEQAQVPNTNTQYSNRSTQKSSWEEPLANLKPPAPPAWPTLASAEDDETVEV